MCSGFRSTAHGRTGSPSSATSRARTCAGCANSRSRRTSSSCPPRSARLHGIRHESGFTTLVRIPYPYTEWNQLYTFPYGVVPYDLDISADGRLVSASVAELNGEQFLRVWEMEKLLKADVKPLSEFKFGAAIPESFVFSKDGRYLYGSSYYTGASNILHHEVATGDVEAVSNAEAGYFRPVPLDDGRLIVLHYTAAGL